MENPYELLFNELKEIKQSIIRLESKISSGKEDEIMNIADAAAFLGISTQTIYGLTSKLKIPFMKPGRNLYFSKQELINWLITNKRKTSMEIDKKAEEHENNKLIKKRHV